LYIGVTQTVGSGGTGLIQFLKDRTLNTTVSYSNIHTNTSNNLMTRLAPILPKVSFFIIDIDIDIIEIDINIIFIILFSKNVLLILTIFVGFYIKNR
jgi:hypothetical protein